MSTNSSGSTLRTRRWTTLLLGRVTALLLGLLLSTIGPAPAWSGPVDWHEVAATDDGQQWWDSGSLRVNKNGNLTVLSRFQPALPQEQTPNANGREPRPPASDLYVMEIDCGQDLYRDTSINGIPQWGSSWQVVRGDGLIETTIRAVCAAGADLLAGS